MLRRRKHGTTDRLALPHQHRPKGEIAETVRSAPGRDPRMVRLIRVLGAMARERGGKGEGKGEGKARERQAKASRPRSISRWPGTGGGLTQWAPAVSFGTTSGISGTFRGADDGSIHFSGTGL